MANKFEFLTQNKKEQLLERLEKEIVEGCVDREFIEYLQEINKLEGIVTVDSCVGHSDEKQGYIIFLMSEEKYSYFRGIIRELLLDKETFLNIREEYKLTELSVIPFIFIRFNRKKFHQLMALLISKLKVAE